MADPLFLARVLAAATLAVLLALSAIDVKESSVAKPHAAEPAAAHS
jgi:hypothetical protein